LDVEGLLAYLQADRPVLTLGSLEVAANSPREYSQAAFAAISLPFQVIMATEVLREHSRERIAAKV
jgi:hypothetical protein